MLKISNLLALSILLSACSEPSHSSSDSSGDDGGAPCLFSFEGVEDCNPVIGGESVEIELKMGEPEYDERALEAVSVSTSGANQELPISSGVTIIDGDKGFVSFQDINFDGHRDLAVTTSFGVSNLYLDYWVYDAEGKEFRYVGNFPKLEPDEERKLLTTQVKVNAESYERKVWVWEEGELASKDPQ